MNKDISKDEQVPSQSTTVQSAHLALSGQTKGLKRLLPFLGPAFIASVAYIDPGNSQRILLLDPNMGIYYFG